MSNISRRTFLSASAGITSALILTPSAAASYFSESSAVSTKSLSDTPVGSGSHSVTIEAFVQKDADAKACTIEWEFAQDEYFEDIVNADKIKHNTESEFGVTVTLAQIPAGSNLYYRFKYNKCHLTVGLTGDGKVYNYHTLPQSEITRTLINLRSRENNAILASSQRIV